MILHRICDAFILITATFIVQYCHAMRLLNFGVNNSKKKYTFWYNLNQYPFCVYAFFSSFNVFGDRWTSISTGKQYEIDAMKLCLLQTTAINWQCIYSSGTYALAIETIAILPTITSTQMASKSTGAQYQPAFQNNSIIMQTKR